MKGHNIIRTKEDGVIKREFDLANCIQGVEVIRNNIEARCQVIRGELLYNILLGIPLHSDKDEIDLCVRNIIETTLGVSEIKKFKSELVNKKYHLSVSVGVGNSEIEVEV